MKLSYYNIIFIPLKRSQGNCPTSDSRIRKQNKNITVYKNWVGENHHRFGKIGAIIGVPQNNLFYDNVKRTKSTFIIAYQEFIKSFCSQKVLKWNIVLPKWRLQSIWNTKCLLQSTVSRLLFFIDFFSLAVSWYIFYSSSCEQRFHY